MIDCSLCQHSRVVGVRIEVLHEDKPVTEWVTTLYCRMKDVFLYDPSVNHDEDPLFYDACSELKQRSYPDKCGKFEVTEKELDSRKNKGELNGK